jgi:L-2-hydroxyglutarate oxidase LhgO
VLRTGTALVHGERAGAGFRLRIQGNDGSVEEIDCDLLVNSAGLWADQVAALLGYEIEETETTPRLKQTVNKGRYYDLKHLVEGVDLKHLVYPMPELRSGGLGVHVTLDIGGGVHFGPDTEWLAPDAAWDYAADDSRREDFARAIRRYLPSITGDDLQPGKVGYRPKLQQPGEEQQDFLVWRDGGYVHLGGIESPGFTSSLALAAYVRDLV